MVFVNAFPFPNKINSIFTPKLNEAGNRQYFHYTEAGGIPCSRLLSLLSCHAGTSSLHQYSSSEINVNYISKYSLQERKLVCKQVITKVTEWIHTDFKSQSRHSPKIHSGLRASN